MGGFSNFAISFSIISILTGAVTLYGYGLEMGGPLEMTLGWPVATFFTLLLAASMAELCSAYPTSGAMYHWAAALGGPASAWFVAWLNIVGLIAALAGINFSCAQFVLPFLGITASATNIFLMFAFTLLGHGLINHYGVRLVALLNNTSVIVHIAGVAAIVGLRVLARAAPTHKVPGRPPRTSMAGGRTPGPSSWDSCRRTGPTPASMGRRTWPKRRAILAGRRRGAW